MGISNRTLPLLERLKAKTPATDAGLSAPMSGDERASSSLAAAVAARDRVGRGGTLLGVGGTPRPPKREARTAVPREPGAGRALRGSLLGF
jgi:hypothetical protein